MSLITGQVEQSFEFTGKAEEVSSSIDQSLNLLEEISKEYKVTVVFDEFQSIVKWIDCEKIQWQLRSKIQKQKNIGYIFSGSSRHLISQLFANSESAFYKSGMMIYVEDSIPTDKLSKWITKQFKKADFKISGEAISKILDTSRSHPYYTQKFCYQIWIDNCLTKKPVIINLEEVYSSLQEIIKAEKTIFQERLDSLSSKQQRVLKALAYLKTDKKIHSKEIIEKFSLTQGSIKAHLKL